MDKNIFEQLDKEPVSYKVVDTIRTALSEGKLKKGDRLPSERDLANQLGISRVPLREGLRILGAYGIVRVKPGEGTFITDEFAFHVFEFLGVGDLNSKKNILDMLEFRKYVETYASERVIKNATQESLDSIIETLENLKNAEDNAERTNADLSFHYQFIELCDNPIVIEMYKMLYKMIGRLISKLIRNQDVFIDTIKQHTDIVEAIKSGDVVKLKTATQCHIEGIEAAVQRYYET